MQPGGRSKYSPEGETNAARRAKHTLPVASATGFTGDETEPGGRHMNDTYVSPSGLGFSSNIVPVADATGNGCAGLRPNGIRPIGMGP